MKRLVFSVGTVTASAAVMALLGAPTAAADGYVGETYGDASSAMSDEGLSPIIASKYGDKLSDDDCIVAAAWAPPFVRGINDFEHASGEMLVSLNCSGAYATATNPGTSVSHPLGRQAKSEAEEEAASQEEEELAAPVTPDE